MTLKNFEDRLVNARKEKGFTQEEFAKRLGVTPQAVSKWERGMGYPDLELLFYICEVLDCSSDYLLHREANKLQLTESGDEKQKRQLLYDILAEPLMLTIGAGLVPVLEEENKNRFPAIKALREKLAIQYGVLFPVLRIRDSLEVGEYDYQITAYDRLLYSETADKDAIITFREMCEHLEIVTLENYDRILNRQMVQTLVDNVAEKYPAAVKGVIPEKISLSLLQEIMSGLAARKKPIRNLVKILEVLEDVIEHTDSVEEMLEAITDRVYN
jgi:flagellar biosynthesis component FlhA